MSGINPRIIEALMEIDTKDKRIIEFIEEIIRKEAINLETNTGQRSSKRYYKELIDKYFENDSGSGQECI